MLEKYIEGGEPLRAIVREFGSVERVRVQIQFVDMMIEREKDRTMLRRAIIEKSTLGALWAVLVFMAIAFFNEIKRHL